MEQLKEGPKEEEEQDYYTQEYLRQQKQQKKSKLFGATIPPSENDAYGLQQVKVQEVLEETRKTDRKNRTRRGNNEGGLSNREDLSNNDPVTERFNKT